MGPGTITYDFIYGAHLEELQRFDDRLVRAIEHQKQLNKLVADGSE
jgi:hypothetical protein